MINLEGMTEWTTSKNTQDTVRWVEAVRCGSRNGGKPVEPNLDQVHPTTTHYAVLSSLSRNTHTRHLLATNQLISSNILG
jgi:hypothetical protein